MNRLRSAGVAFVAALASVLVALTALPAEAQDFPRLTGRVVDQADVLSPQTEAELTEKLAALEARTTDQVVVATVSSLEGYAIEDYGYRLGRSWGIGQSERTQTADDRSGRDNGVILLVAPNDRKVRIEVGYGLEPVITDALASVIINQAVLPKFRDGDLPGGIVAGTDAIVEQLSLDRGVAIERAAQVEAAPSEPDVPIWVIVLVILFFVFFGRGWLPWFVLGNIAGGGWRGGGGGGWSGGGGFSGGGGSFGGGGASGGW